MYAQNSHRSKNAFLDAMPGFVFHRDPVSEAPNHVNSSKATRLRGSLRPKRP